MRQAPLAGHPWLREEEATSHRNVGGERERDRERARERESWRGGEEGREREIKQRETELKRAYK